MSLLDWARRIARFTTDHLIDSETSAYNYEEQAPTFKRALSTAISKDISENNNLTAIVQIGGRTGNGYDYANYGVYARRVGVA